MSAREIEFKFAVNGSAAFKQLTDHLGLPSRLLDCGVVQTNHFFDTANHTLQSLGAIVRLREQNAGFTLTVKEMADQETIQTALTERLEYEAYFDSDIACAVLSSKSLSLERLKASLVQHSCALAHLLDRGGIEQSLDYVGHFTNTRIHLPVKLHTANGIFELIMELDSSDFPGHLTSHEIEVEITSHQYAAQIQSALLQLLGSAGITWRTTTNKAVRFFTALNRLRI